MSARGRLLAPAAVAGVSGVLSAATLVVAVINRTGVKGFIAENQANTWLAGVSSGLVAVLILRSSPTNRLGGVFAAASVLAAGSALSAELTATAFGEQPPRPWGDLTAWMGGLLWMPAFLLVLVAVPLLFPDGRLASLRWRWPARIALTTGALAVIAAGGTDTIVVDVNPAASHPLGSPVPDSVLLPVALVCFAVTVVVGLAATVAIIVRMRRLDEPQRQQHAWYVAAVVLVLAVTWLPVPDWVSFLGNGLSVAAMGVAVVRYQLFDIELVLSRAFVYGLLTAGTLAAYLATAAVLGQQVGSGAGPAIVAAAVAVALAGLRGRIQRTVDRALYGGRDEPLVALSQLGERIGRTVATDELLPTVADTVRETLRVPYAAVELAGEAMPAHASGRPVDGLVRVPLVHGNEPVGMLVIGLRRGEVTLSSADERLVHAFGAQIAAAVHDARVTRELRRSRERIVLAREEERRRLRRDLHDGLGPALAGIALGLETAGRSAARSDPRLADLLVRLHDEAAGCAADVREIVADLRPPVLDTAGLMTALDRHADLITSRSNGQLRVTVEGPELPSLPAAVEVAAYRIAMEALTNTVRHADAHTCRVSVQLDGGLRLTLRDDGNGVPGPSAGMGLSSMRDRAEELGGACTVTFSEGVGTTVEALLPLEPA